MLLTYILLSFKSIIPRMVIVFFVNVVLNLFIHFYFPGSGELRILYLVLVIDLLYYTITFKP